MDRKLAEMDISCSLPLPSVALLLKQSLGFSTGNHCPLQSLSFHQVNSTFCVCVCEWSSVCEWTLPTKVHLVKAMVFQ